MRFKLYALSYKALSYAEIQKDLNKEIYKENKTEKGRDWKSSTNIYKSRISSEFISADSFHRKQKKGGSGGIPESEGRSESPNPSSAGKSENLQKNLPKFGRFRLSAPYINP